MPGRSANLPRLYGAGALHLVSVVLCLAITAAALTIVADDPARLAMLTWFLAAVVLHDLVLFPLYSAADRMLATSRARVPVINHIRVPLLGTGLTFLLFLPGIIREGEPVVIGQTGLDQSPFLIRWLLLTTTMITASALVYTIRLRTARRREQHQLDLGG